MTISKTKDGRWVARPNLGRGPDGKRIQRRKTFSTRREAESWCNEMESRSGHMSRYTLSDFFDTMYAPFIQGKVRRNTWLLYERDFNSLVRDSIGDMRLDDIRPYTIQRLIDSRPTWGSKRNALRICRQVLGKAKDWGLIPSLPTDGCDLPSHRREPIIIADPSRLPEYLDAVRTYKPEIIAGFCVTLMGARRSEVCGLQWSDVTFGDDVRVSIHTSRTETLGEVIDGDTKTEKSRRVLVMPQWLGNIMRERRGVGMVVNVKPDAYSRAFRSAVKSAGLPDVRLKDLRHTFGTFLASESVPVEMIQQALGHELVTTTSAYYLQQTETAFTRASDTMGRLFDFNRCTDNSTPSGTYGHN